MRRALRFICEYIAANGKSPTFSEIQTGLCYCDKMLVKRVVKDLKEHGYIDSWPRKHRGIFIPNVRKLPKDLYHDQ